MSELGLIFNDADSYKDPVPYEKIRKIYTPLPNIRSRIRRPRLDHAVKHNYNVWSNSSINRPLPLCPNSELKYHFYVAISIYFNSLTQSDNDNSDLEEESPQDMFKVAGDEGTITLEYDNFGNEDDNYDEHTFHGYRGKHQSGSSGYSTNRTETRQSYHHLEETQNSTNRSPEIRIEDIAEEYDPQNPATKRAVENPMETIEPIEQMMPIEQESIEYTPTKPDPTRQTTGDLDPTTQVTAEKSKPFQAISDNENTEHSEREHSPTYGTRFETVKEQPKPKPEAQRVKRKTKRKPNRKAAPTTTSSSSASATESSPSSNEGSSPSSDSSGYERKNKKIKKTKRANEDKLLTKLKKENKKHKLLKKTMAKMQKDLYQLKNREKMEEVLKNKINIIDEKMRIDQERVDEITNSKVNHTPKSRKRNREEESPREPESDIMNEKTRLISRETDEEENTKAHLQKLTNEVGQLKKSIQNIDREHGSPKNTSTPITSLKVRWSPSQTELPRSNPQPSTSHEDPQSRSHSHHYNNQRDIKERLDFSRRPQQEDARESILRKRQDEEKRERNLALVKVNSTINERQMDRERREDHQPDRYRRSPERSPRRGLYEEREEPTHEYKRYISRTASHLNDRWSPSPPKLLRTFRHNDEQRSPYNLHHSDHYDSPSQHQRDRRTYEPHRGRQDREYEYERQSTGYGRGAGYNQYKR